VDSTRASAERLRQLHRDPAILVLVNAWDVASAQAIAGQPGCAAVATASHAIAAAYGYEDGEHIPADLMLDAVGRIAAAVDVPVTADLEAGYGDVDRTIRTAVQAGVVGANLEDQLRPVAESAALMAAAVQAAEAEGVPLVLNARTDAYLRGEQTETEAVLDRGKAFLDSGAECFFVPGCRDLATLTSLVEVLGPGRVSAMWMPGGPSPKELEAVGVARVSFGPFAQRHVLAHLGATTRVALAGEGLPESP
jgi:2-methylisocitrate lyase-like PEP mutase family enzyme